MKAYIIASSEQTQKTEREWLKINRATKIETRIWSTKHEERSVTSNLTEEAAGEEHLEEHKHSRHNW